MALGPSGKTLKTENHNLWANYPSSPPKSLFSLARRVCPTCSLSRVEVRCVEWERFSSSRLCSWDDHVLKPDKQKENPVSSAVAMARLIHMSSRVNHPFQVLSTFYACCGCSAWGCPHRLQHVGRRPFHPTHRLHVTSLPRALIGQHATCQQVYASRETENINGLWP